VAVVTGRGLDVPYQNQLLDKNGILTVAWQQFFRMLYLVVSTLGIETSFPLVNNQVLAADITGLQFDSRKINQVSVEYLIQRVTTGGGATELITAGMFMLAYKPTSETWHVVAIGTPGPSSSGITFSVTASGQVQYTSSNITGTASISKITYRARTLGARYAT